MNGERVGSVGTVVIAQKRNIIDWRLPSHIMMCAMLCLQFNGLTQQCVKTTRWQHDTGRQERLQSIHQAGARSDIFAFPCGTLVQLLIVGAHHVAWQLMNARRVVLEWCQFVAQHMQGVDGARIVEIFQILLLQQQKLHLDEICVLCGELHVIAVDDGLEFLEIVVGLMPVAA